MANVTFGMYRPSARRSPRSPGLALAFGAVPDTLGVLAGGLPQAASAGLRWRVSTGVNTFSSQFPNPKTCDLWH
eukprot:2891847-Amphidinium_carterae.1